jgi:periplasmic divalent cation tolerance protein
VSFIQVVTATDSEESAGRLAQGVAGARLAASVQITGPIKSFYWWKGELVEAREWQLAMKTTSMCSPRKCNPTARC